MSRLRSLCASALLLVPSVPVLAQPSRALVPERQVHLDFTPVGAAVGFAARTSDRTAFGVEIGGGGNWLNYMLYASSHFGARGDRSSSVVELAHATVFVRTHFSGSRHLDVGAKASGFLHFDSSDDDPGGGYFVGLNGKYSWAKWRRINFASEMDAGRYAEPRSGSCSSGCDDVQAFGVTIAPIVVRITFP